MDTGGAEKGCGSGVSSGVTQKLTKAWMSDASHVGARRSDERS